MPGVPTSRGCDACRQQRKKCDASSSACSRCRRLGVCCVGFGQQRYKFKDEGRKLALRNKESSPAENDTLMAQRAPTAVEFIRVPSNSLNRLTMAYVDKIDRTMDISVQLVGNFGGFLHEIPCRLGTNSSLDAAADVLVAAYTRYCAGYREADADVLVKHSHALNSLGQCLNDPVRAHSSETLCSIMVLLICQIFMGKSAQPWMSHSVGAAQILKSRGYSGPQNDFERLLLLSLRGPVVLEALFDGRIRFTNQEWKDLVATGLDNGTVDGKLMSCLGRMPEMMRRSRDALKVPEISYFVVVELRSGMHFLRQEFRSILRQLRQRFEDTSSAMALGDPLAPGLGRRMAHCHSSRMLAFGLAVGITINCVLGTLKAEDHELPEENARMSIEILELAESVTMYRPLGTLSMILWLSAAWRGTTDLVTRFKIEASILDYLRDIYGPKVALAMREELKLSLEHSPRL